VKRSAAYISAAAMSSHRAARAFQPVDDHLATAAHLPTEDERNTASHEARKAAKRVRYAAVPHADRRPHAFAERSR
jgi:hypothetical protein